MLTSVMPLISLQKVCIIAGWLSYIITGRSLKCQIPNGDELVLLTIKLFEYEDQIRVAIPGLNCVCLD